MTEYNHGDDARGAQGAGFEPLTGSVPVYEKTWPASAVRAEHVAGGKVLHAAADCPRDRTCLVWDDWHPPVSRDELTDGILSTLTEIAYGNGEDTLEETRLFIEANAEALGERAERFIELCEAIEILAQRGADEDVLHEEMKRDWR